jgi:threonine dehydratase
MVEAPNRTCAEGLATGTAFALPQAILWEYLKDFILLADQEILRAMVWMVERAHTLAEAAGAAPLAAAYRLREELKGIKVGLVCSGKHFAGTIETSTFNAPEPRGLRQARILCGSAALHST